MLNSTAALGLFAFALGFSLVAVPGNSRAQVLDWTIDPAHSSAQFAVRHMMVSTVRGQLGKVSGTVRFDGKDLSTLTVDASIDVAGINTQEPKRDAHLRSADFFEVDKYPAITFRSKRAEPAGDGRFKLVGDLTMRGVTREVILDVEGPTPEVRQGASRRVGATASTKLSRKDYGLTWNRAVETGGVVVGDEVSVTIDLALVRKDATGS
ncbi:MAG: YceI family protein [Vicinamibacterales bacterium]